MAKDVTFDVVSKVDMQEVGNAVNQTNKEISQRFDFKNSVSSVEVQDGSIKVIADDEFKLKSVLEILQTRLIRRGVSIRNMDYGKIEEASKGSVRQIIKIKQGIETDTAKKIVKDVKDLKLKVQAQIMDDQVRFSGKQKDDLQEVIRFLKDKDYLLELQFVNYRE